MSFYGDIFRWFYGIIVETGTDPEGLDRVKVRVDGIHSHNISDADLPLAQCVLPTTGGGTSGVGENPRLEAGARVFGFFADGNLCQAPIIIGCIPHIAEPTETQKSIKDGSSEAVITSVRPQTRSLETGFTPLKTPTGEAADNPHIAWKFFSTSPGLCYHYKPHHIAGMIGNLTIEGRFDGIEMNPLARGKEKEGTVAEYEAFGIAQWGPDRQEKLKAFANREKDNYRELLPQLKFIDYELSRYSYHRGPFFFTETVEEATMMFMRFYEMPQIKSGLSKFTNNGTFGYPRRYWNIRFAEENRLKAAKEAYNKFTQLYKEQ